MPSVAHRVDDSVWAGASLLDELFCGCRIGKPHHTEYYTDNPIIRFAQEYPVGSSTFFETAFNQAFWQVRQ